MKEDEEVGEFHACCETGEERCESDKIIEETDNQQMIEQEKEQEIVIVCECTH